MAIYKLSEICDSISETKKPKFPQKIINTGDVYMGVISPKVVNKNILGQFKKTAKIGDILFSEIRPGNGRWAMVNDELDSLISTKMLVIRPNENVLTKYLYFVLTTKLNKEIVNVAFSRSGTFPQITFDTISHLRIEIPLITEQQKIIDIIEPNEELFIKYSNTVRIDSFSDCKDDLKNLIDIIEPIEKLIINAELIISKIYKIIKYNNNQTIGDYTSSISTGYSYSGRDYSEKGRFKVFKTTNINSDKYQMTNFEKNNFVSPGSIITGLSGTIGTGKVIFDENVVNNQRTLALISDYPYQIKKCIEENINLLKSRAHGAAQLNIKVSDILGLKFGVDNPNREKLFSKVLLSLEKEINYLKNIKSDMINILIK